MSPPPKVNVEEAFDSWYNASDRKTLAAVAVEFGVSYRTMLRYSEDGDWQVRADRLDELVQAEKDARIAKLIGKSRADDIQVLATLKGRFYTRLREKYVDDNGVERTNPAYLAAGEIGIPEYERLLKMFELLAGNPTFRLAIGEGDGPDQDLTAALEEMQQRIIEAEMATAGELPAATDGGSHGEG